MPVLSTHLSPNLNIICYTLLLLSLGALFRNNRPLYKQGWHHFFPILKWFSFIPFVFKCLEIKENWMLFLGGDYMIRKKYFFLQLSLYTYTYNFNDKRQNAVAYFFIIYHLSPYGKTVFFFNNNAKLIDKWISWNVSLKAIYDINLQRANEYKINSHLLKKTNPVRVVITLFLCLK